MALTDYKTTGTTGSFTPLVELNETMDFLDTVLYFARTNFPRIDSLQVGMAVLVDDEFMYVTEILAQNGNLPPGVRVLRGTADTIPAVHVKGSLAWFIDAGVVGTDTVQYGAGDTTAVKYSPYTNSTRYEVDTSGEIDEVTYNWRAYRPYPPGRMRVNDLPWFNKTQVLKVDQKLDITWTHRDRVLQGDKLIDHGADNIGPEPGTTYTARIYTENGDLRRTEVGIMANSRDLYGQVVSPRWGYHWDQAMVDLGLGEGSEAGENVPGFMTIFSTRDGFDSWQGYRIDFTVNTQGFYMNVSQLGQISAQSDDIEQSSGPVPPTEAVMAGAVGQIAAQRAKNEDYQDVIGSDAIFVAAIQEGVGQATSFYTGLNRNLFESPYAHVVSVGLPVIAGVSRLVTVAARPGDRLTDSHKVWTRYDYPSGIGESLPYNHRIDPNFTPWVTLAKPIDYLETTIEISNSSFFDGVPLDSVIVGQAAMLDAEVVVVRSRTATTISIARGAFDTVPAKHVAGARVWFFQAAGGNDLTRYPYTIDPKTQVPGAAAQVKMVPDVYGPPLDLNQVPTDRLMMAYRADRPYPPGEVLVNGRAWYNGAIVEKDQLTVITWRHRNRIVQGSLPVSHHEPARTPEAGQKYRLKIELTIRSGSRDNVVTVRSEIVDGDFFLYTYAMAQADGYRAGTLLKACGRVTVGIVLEAIRDDFVSWQNYVIPLLLPSFACPPGKPPGGGQLPPTTGGGGGGGGNGNTGADPSNPGSPPSGGGGGGNTGGGGGGGDNTGGGDTSPGGSGGGNNGSGPVKPPEVPPDWPDPIDPPVVEEPVDPNPDLAAHWDTNWDRHWDAYNKDNQGS